MLGPLRRKFGACCGAIASLLPNVSKVSFLGERGIRTGVAIEEAAATEAAAAGETAATTAVTKVATTVGTRTAAGVVGAGALAGGAVAESKCGWGVAKLVSKGASEGGAVEALPGLARQATREGAEIADSLTAKSLTAGEKLAAEDGTAAFQRIRPEPAMPRVMPRMPLLVPTEDGAQAAARSAINTKGIHFSGADTSVQTVMGERLASQVLRQESVSLAADVLRSLPQQTLQSDAEIARAFDQVFASRSWLKYDLNPSTGLLRVYYPESGLTAEFNAYAVIRAAVSAGAAVPPVSTRNPEGLKQ